MNKILFSCSPCFIPPKNSAPYKLLLLLMDGNPHHKDEILMVLNDDPRSARQQLTSENFGYWLIHNIGIKKAIYKLDKRHLSGNKDKDKEARKLALEQLQKRSKKQWQPIETEQVGFKF